MPENMTICYDEFFLNMFPNIFLFSGLRLCEYLFLSMQACLTVKPVHFVKDQVIDMKGIGSVIGPLWFRVSIRRLILGLTEYVRLVVTVNMNESS